MSKDYEGKIGIGQLILCLIAAATLLIPVAIEPAVIFAVNKITPIGTTSEVAAVQITFSRAVFEALNMVDKIPEPFFNSLPYAMYGFYGIVAFDLLFTLILMVLRSEILRQIARAVSIFLGFIMIFITLAFIPAIAGFFTYFMQGGFGDALIFDCIKNGGLLFFAGLFIMSIVVTTNQFSSFFGKTH